MSCRRAPSRAPPSAASPTASVHALWSARLTEIIDDRDRLRGPLEPRSRSIAIAARPVDSAGARLPAPSSATQVPPHRGHDRRVSLAGRPAQDPSASLGQRVGAGDRPSFGHVSEIEEAVGYQRVCAAVPPRISSARSNAVTAESNLP